jgi:hypothetical protein
MYVSDTSHRACDVSMHQKTIQNTNTSCRKGWIFRNINDNIVRNYNLHSTRCDPPILNLLSPRDALGSVLGKNQEWSMLCLPVEETKENRILQLFIPWDALSHWHVIPWVWLSLHQKLNQKHNSSSTKVWIMTQYMRKGYMYQHDVSAG